MKMNGILTRRDFLGASVLAFQGVLLMPDAAHADQANASVLENSSRWWSYQRN